MIQSFRQKYFGDKKFYKMIMAIALPIIVQSLMTNMVNLLDNVMVGRLGTDQMMGVAIINQLFFVFNLAVFGGMSAAGIFSAQYFGAKNDKGVRNVLRLKIIIDRIMIKREMENRFFDWLHVVTPALREYLPLNKIAVDLIG